MKSAAREAQRPEDPPMFTGPFRFVSRLKVPKTGLDAVPVLDLMVIALLLSLLFTRFVVLPGVRVDLPVTDLEMQHSHSRIAVMTIGHNDMLFFNGSVFDEATIQEAFQDFIATSPNRDVALLVKFQASMEMQAFLALCRAAQEAGFSQVQVAGRKNDELIEALSGRPANESSVPPSFVF